MQPTAGGSTGCLCVGGASVTRGGWERGGGLLWGKEPRAGLWILPLVWEEGGGCIVPAQIRGVGAVCLM